MGLTALNRRTFLTSGAAGSLCALSGLGAHAPSFNGPALEPFARSPTVITYDHWHFADETDFPPLRQVIDAELFQTGTPNIYYWEYRQATGPAPKDSASDKIERRRATFFARLAVEYIAPRALRRAGFEQMAADVVSGALVPAGAQHTIGAANATRCRAAGAPSPMPALEMCAYGASGHASSAVFYATSSEVDVVHQTGWFCGAALLAASFYDDAAVENPADVWDFAERAINAAMAIGHDHAAQTMI